MRTSPKNEQGGCFDVIGLKIHFATRPVPLLILNSRKLGERNHPSQELYIHLHVSLTPQVSSFLQSDYTFAFKIFGVSINLTDRNHTPNSHPSIRPTDQITYIHKMGLFSRHEVDEAPAVPEKTYVESDVPSRRSTLFGHRRSEESNVTRTSVSTSHTSPRSSGVLHRGSMLYRGEREDPSIAAARERVLNAEVAEREADKALNVARAAVREAREQVKRLEREAEEEARLAKIKQKQAANISKRGQMLGRMYFPARRTCVDLRRSCWLI